MTPEEFKNNWTDEEEPLVPLSLNSLENFDLLLETKLFLSIAGLPNSTCANLNFADNIDDVVYGIKKLTDQYDFEEYKEEYEKYIVIGSCRDGDAIAIDTSQNDRIVELDHEDSFCSMYFNSSINQLAEFLIIYKEFESNVSSKGFEFTDEDFEKMKKRMSEVDNAAMTERGFWKEELEMMLSLRQDERDS
jgi:hypothetical protein